MLLQKTHDFAYCCFVTGIGEVSQLECNSTFVVQSLAYKLNRSVLFIRQTVDNEWRM